MQLCTGVRTKENNTEATCVVLRWVAKRLETCVHLRENLSSIKVDTSHRKPSQVYASRGQMESQGTPSFQLAITCDSSWPRLTAILKINGANSIDHLEGRKKT